MLSNDHYLPDDVIPGWKVYVHRNWYDNPLNFSKKILYTATNGQICLTRAIEISEDMIRYRDPKLYEYIDEEAVYNLRQDAIKWALTNDEDLLALQRHLDYGLNNR